ncbi:MAG: LysR family transcriptional regulator [Pseudomonadota bacterium]
MNSEFNEIDLRKLDLNLLLVFSALMREGSVAAAAKRLYLGPSAVSMALARLRESLGDALFVRAGTGMEPTPRALTLWTEVEPALGRIGSAVQDRAFDPATTTRLFRLGAPNDLEIVLVPDLIERLGTEAPGARLVVQPADFHTLYDSLDRGIVDLALSALPARAPSARHRTRLLRRERFSAVYDRAMLGRTGCLDLDCFLAAPHVLLSLRGDLYGPVDKALEAIGRSRTILATVSHFPTMPFILRRRRAIACIPSIAAYHFSSAFDLEQSPLPIQSPEFDLGLAWHVRGDADPAQIWFRELVAACVADLSRVSD